MTMMIRQSVVDVLMFIFERFLGEDNEVAEERKDIHSHLEERWAFVIKRSSKRLTGLKI